MKTCVFIIGTNAVGKTTLAKEIISNYGGIGSMDEKLTYCKDSRVVMAGRYEDGKKFGGVDGFGETKILEDVVRTGLKDHEIIFCEGSFLASFGMNLLNAAFSAQKQLVVYLYAPIAEINKRLIDRSGTGIKNDAVCKKQKSALTSAKKWASIGVPVLTFDTSKHRTKEIAKEILSNAEKLCGLDTTDK